MIRAHARARAGKLKVSYAIAASEALDVTSTRTTLQEHSIAGVALDLGRDAARCVYVLLRIRALVALVSRCEISTSVDKRSRYN